MTKYIANLYQDELMVCSIHGSKFKSLLVDLLNRLEANKTYTHGFIRNSQTGAVKIFCRKTKE